MLLLGARQVVGGRDRDELLVHELAAAQQERAVAVVEVGRELATKGRDLRERHLADVRAKIADLKRIEKVLADTAAQCSGEELPECPVLEALAS